MGSERELGNVGINLAIRNMLRLQMPERFCCIILNSRLKLEYLIIYVETKGNQHQSHVPLRLYIRWHLICLYIGNIGRDIAFRLLNESCVINTISGRYSLQATLLTKPLNCLYRKEYQNLTLYSWTSSLWVILMSWLPCQCIHLWSLFVFQILIFLHWKYRHLKEFTVFVNVFHLWKLSHLKSTILWMKSIEWYLDWVSLEIVTLVLMIELVTELMEEWGFC